MTLSIQKSKANFYSYKQHDLENFQCLEKFHNLVQILALNDDNLYCKVIIDYVVQQIYSKKSNDITPGHLNQDQEAFKEVYLEIEFINISGKS